MKIWRKILFWLLLFGVLSLWGYSLVSASGSTIGSYEANMFLHPETADTTTIWIDTLGTTWDRWWGLIQVIKNAINWVLWILSLIALVLCLWWWFQIVTAAWDDGKQKKWVSVLKHAAIWLVVIWLSWFIVTIVFWLLRGVTWAGV